MPTAAPWADVACRGSRDGRPHRPRSKYGHRSRRSGKPTGSVSRSLSLPSCVLQLPPLSPAQAARTTRGRPQLRPQDWIRSQTPGSPPVRRSQTSAAVALRAVDQCRSSMAGSPGHQLADPDHQQWSPHHAQICAAGAERGIDAATAPNGGTARALPDLSRLIVTVWRLVCSLRPRLSALAAEGHRRLVEVPVDAGSARPPGA